MVTEDALITGVAAGVPFVARPPAGGRRPGARVVVAWHLGDPPRTESAFAAALPLHGLDAWRIYLGLPLSGSRLPEGGQEEIMRLGFEDAVLNLQGPVTSAAFEEFAPAFAQLRSRFALGERPIGVLGGSIGSAVAQLVIAAGAVPVSAAVLVSPVVQLRPVVDGLARRFGISYVWSPASQVVARRLDFVARADEIADNGAPAMLLVVGADDDATGFLAPARQLREALVSRYAEPTRVSLAVVPGMAHALAEEPGTAPAPQTPHAVEVDRKAVAWFESYLMEPA